MILRRAILLATGREGFVDQVVDFRAAFAGEANEHFCLAVGIADGSRRKEALKLFVREQHRVNFIADDHAGGRFVGELRIERVADLREKLDRLLEVLDGEIDEDFSRHDSDFRKGRGW